MNKDKRTTSQAIVIAMLGILLICGCSMWIFFGEFLPNYQNSVSKESAGHLLEINNHIKMLIGEEERNDWLIIESLADTLQSGKNRSEEALFEVMQREMLRWNVSSICIYTKDGRGWNETGQGIQIADVIEMIREAQTNGRYMNTIGSTAFYMMPLQLELQIEGSEIAAISVIQDLNTLIDKMDISSFGGNAEIYLTQPDGMIISRLNSKTAAKADNILTLFENGSCEYIGKGKASVEEMLADDTEHSFIHKLDGYEEYVSVAPITTENGIWHLFYVIPEAIINENMNTFSSYVMLLCTSMVVIMFILCLCLFILLYKKRAESMDAVLISRERLFDLLVSNTKNAFALLAKKQKEPLYVTSNMNKLLGGNSISMDTEAVRFQMLCRGAGSEAVKQLNAELAQWDESSDFVSGYLPCETEKKTSYIVMRIYPVEGSRDEYIVVAQDVTQEREREEALKNVLSIAQSANIAKTKFLSNMSHDIRTPMNAIVNMTAFAMESMDDREMLSEYLETIKSSSDHLLHLLNDILDMSRIESGKIILASEPFDMKECLNDTVEIIKSLAGQKGQKLMFACDIRHFRLKGDELKLSQILINLLNNAVKFTPEGGSIHFEITELKSLKSETASYRFLVRDNGIGISEDSLVKIFEPFSRGKDASVRKIEGTGLGLSITKNFVEAMGGSITVSSKPGEGTEFVVELFFENDFEVPRERKEDNLIEDVSFEGSLALLCEDNEINRKIAVRLLERIGFQVQIACDGGEAVSKFLMSETGTYRVIFMDIQMPIMNGYEATAEIRNSEHPEAASIPIIAMTGDVFAEDVEKARAAGMNRHIGKPLNLAELARTAQSVLES